MSKQVRWPLAQRRLAASSDKTRALEQQLREEKDRHAELQGELGKVQAEEVAAKTRIAELQAKLREHPPETPKPEPTAQPKSELPQVRLGEADKADQECIAALEERMRKARRKHQPQRALGQHQEEAAAQAVARRTSLRPTSRV